MVKILKILFVGFLWFLVFNIPYKGKPLFVTIQHKMGIPLTLKKSWDTLNSSEDKASKALSGIKYLKEKFTQK